MLVTMQERRETFDVGRCSSSSFFAACLTHFTSDVRRLLCETPLSCLYLFKFFLPSKTPPPTYHPLSYLCLMVLLWEWGSASVAAADDLCLVAPLFAAPSTGFAEYLFFDFDTTYNNDCFLFIRNELIPLK